MHTRVANTKDEPYHTHTHTNKPRVQYFTSKRKKTEKSHWKKNKFFPVFLITYRHLLVIIRNAIDNYLYIGVNYEMIIISNFTEYTLLLIIYKSYFNLYLYLYIGNK